MRDVRTMDLTGWDDWEEPPVYELTSWDMLHRPAKNLKRNFRYEWLSPMRLR